MARRKEFKDIASGILGSFISRNNDFNGYWGIGQLSLHAQQESVSVIQLDLLSGSITPPNAFLSELISDYSVRLKKQLSARRIPLSWLASAIIQLDLKPTSPLKHVPITTWGTLFRLSVALKDDRGRVHEASGYGYCGPHNAKKECRSSGRKRV